jgi:hypothetical protein
MTVDQDLDGQERLHTDSIMTIATQITGSKVCTLHTVQVFEGDAEVAIARSVSIHVFDRPRFRERS